jgi:hypothetical protein
MPQQNKMKSITILILFIQTEVRKTSPGSRRSHVTALSLGSTYITGLFHPDITFWDSYFLECKTSFFLKFGA